MSGRAFIIAHTINHDSLALSDDQDDPELAHSKTSLPFQGMIICFTRITDEKRDLVNKLKSMGVSSVPDDLPSAASALICRYPEGEKYQVSTLLFQSVVSQSVDLA